MQHNYKTWLGGLIFGTTSHTTCCELIDDHLHKTDLGFGEATVVVGINSEKGCRWVERILSLRQTCRLQGKSTFTTLVDAFDCYFKEQQPDLSWIRQATQQ